MKRLIGLFFLILTLLPMSAQHTYISNSRLVEADRIADLSGNSGILLLSKNHDLVIDVVNSSKRVVVNRTPELVNGYYEYTVVIDSKATKTPKLEISRRGSVYKTEIVQSVKPDFYIAYRLDEVSHPIRMDDQTQANDAHLNAAEAALELTTTIKNLQVQCHPDLMAKIHSEVSKVDPNVTITTIVIPVSVLTDSKQRIKDLHQEVVTLDNQINGDLNHATDAMWDKLDALEEAEQHAAVRFRELTTVSISASGSNQLSIDISDFGPRTKKNYAVLPLVIEKNIFVTECSSFMAEGAKLYGLRKYKESKAAYESAWSSSDVIAKMRRSIRESIDYCDTCIVYEKLAKEALIKMNRLKERGTTTQQELSRYVIAAIDYFGVLNNLNPCDFYRGRIQKLNKLLGDLPLELKFTIVEWKTLEEGLVVPDVEIWAYYGDVSQMEGSFSSDRKFRKLLEKEKEHLSQIGLTDAKGVTSVDLNRSHLPVGLFFRPSKDQKIKIHYMSLQDIFQKAQGTYIKKQIRLRMYSRQ